MFCTNNSKTAWKGLRTITGFVKKSAMPEPDDVKAYSNELNNFYARFDNFDFHTEREELIEVLRRKNYVKITLSDSDVLESLNSIKVNKAVGPDKLCGKILKLCRTQLTPVFKMIFQWSLDNSRIPSVWKTSEIIPVPKSNLPKCVNDLRPVALTSIAMKCFEKVIKKELCSQVSNFQDVLQFAYSKNRCVQDATLTMIQHVQQFLDVTNTQSNSRYVKILFVDFSSAFNTIQPHVLMKKLIDMNVNSHLILWINDFLVNRVQYVKFSNTFSDCLITNTGAPQGCVLSPLLFTLYTSDCRSNNENCFLIKYADDSALVGLCKNSDDIYREEVVKFVKWCDNNYLELNVKKKIIIDFRMHCDEHECLVLKNEKVETVKEYKYLGTIIDDKLSFTSNVDMVYKKANTRMFYVRKLRHL
jgi:hypothetical protein